MRPNEARARAAAARLWPLALTILSAQLFGLAYPPHRVRILAWLALAPFFVALRGVGLRHALLLGWVWSVLAAWSVGEWMPGAIENYYLQTKLVGWLFFLGIATVMVAPYHTAFALCARSLWQRPGPALPLLLAAAWTAAELGRGRLFTGTPFFIGNPWALLGYSQVGWLPVTQIADLAGVYGISFVAACANAGLAVAWSAWRDGAPQRRLLAACIATALIPAAASIVYGAVRLSGSETTGSAAEEVPVAIIQGDVSFGSRWRSEYYGRDLETYLRLTLEALQSRRPRMVFWPESSMTFFLEREPAYRSAIASVLAPFGAQLMAGAPRTGSEAGPPFYNSIYVISPRGELLSRYDKQHLVPFGEYFPFGSVELLRRRFGPAREFSPGASGAALPTLAGPAGILTCNEAMLPEVAAQRVADGARYLVNPSNDTWIPGETFAELQFDIVSLRAVEQRRTLVRASTSGPSAIVDADGRVLARTKTFTREVLLGAVQPHDGRTIYGRVGDAFAVGCLLLAVGGWVRATRGSATPPSRSDS
jgi:apolipoprotein N-acyltransferase